MANEKEIWKDIDGFPGYQVSNLGRVYSNLTKKILKPEKMDKGYLRVALYNPDTKIKKRIMVHALVANAFIGDCPDGYQIDHVDTNKENNKVSNLEYVTCKENIDRAIEIGLRDRSPTREALLASIETNRKPVKCIETGEVFNSVVECSKRLNVNEDGIRKCINNRAKSANNLHFECVDKKKKTTSFLYDYQMDAVNKLHNGCILCGSVGSGKSRTGLFYYFKENGGWIDENGYQPMRHKPKPQDLYIITTAKKRNSLEWEGELANFRLSTDPKKNMFYGNTIIVDSWNNIGKYKDVENAFFLLDEQRIVGNGAWVKSFLKIAKNNNWILLTGTPGDSYMDYVPVFLANGFFKNRTEFNREHVIYSRFSKYPKIEGYQNTRRLDRLRDRVLVKMNYKHKINTHHEDVYCKYDIAKYKEVMRTRWNIYKDEPIEQASGLCYVLRRIVNTDESREVALMEILEQTEKAIIFYNFDYELDMLHHLFWSNDGNDNNPLSSFEVAEYNGHCHQDIPNSKKWVYLCQYTAACEGWECIKTDTIIFFSQNYSYKVMAQAAGRIDRLNTPYKELYYYHLKSRSGIDLAISKALDKKKKFNESKWVNW
jgi:hypothetical protein